ncbi:MAG: FKBP-type peptidyl-prolyl cis-trans isomerase [Ilumatobacteraceae bacterium]
MRRRPAAILVFAVLVVAGCGGSDGAASTSTVAPTPSSDTIGVPVAIDGCEDAPDPAAYIIGQIPPVLRPCTIPAELQVQPIRTGSGPAAEAGDTLFVDYTGVRSDDGVVFDTSYTRGTPLDFPLGRGGVIDGWDQGLVGARAGSAIKLNVPAALAYGDAPPAGDKVRAGDALTFVVEVRAVVPSSTADDAPLDLQLDPSVGATEVTTTDLVTGDGPELQVGQTAIVRVLLVRGDNQVVLFNSWERDESLQIKLEEGNGLAGFFEGLPGAQVGTLREIIMPPDQAFGPQGDTGLGLPPGTDLIVIAEVLGVY